MEIEKAAARFGNENFTWKPLGAGLINDTYYVSYAGGTNLVLQKINTHSFPQPLQLIRNYERMAAWLEAHPPAIPIPHLVQTVDGSSCWIDEKGDCWRATAWIPGTYSPPFLENTEMAVDAARAYAGFIASLGGAAIADWEPAIPGFHDLSQRYHQFEAAMHGAELFRRMKATHIISSLRERSDYLRFYEEMMARPTDYPERLQHHDCKLSNLLFDKKTHRVVAITDLDTVMPGSFFSDLGDMVRSMTCTEPEDSVEWDKIAVDEDRYHAIVNTFRETLKGQLTAAEQEHLHLAGRLITYMQALRYTTDFLQNDIYYKITSPEQNLHRAFNQLLLLERLEEIG